MTQNPFDPPQNFNGAAGQPQQPQHPGAQPNGFQHNGFQQQAPQQGGQPYPPQNYPPQQFAQPQAPEPKKNWFARHKILTAILALVVVVILVNAFGSSDDENPSADSTSASTVEESSKEKETEDKAADNKTSKDEKSEKEEKAEKKESEPKGFKIGDVAAAGDMTYKVHSVKTASSVGTDFLAEKAKGEFVIVEIEVTNNSNDSSLVTSSFFTLKQGEKKYEANSMASLVANSDRGNDDFLVADLNPDLTMKGVIVFDVSEKVAKAKDNVLQAQTGFWGTETVDITLAK